MDWNQVLTIVGTNIALILASLGTTITLFLWARSEASQDRRQFHEEIREDRKDLLTLMRGIQDETKAIQSEIREFHNRLIDIERKRTDP